jgi:hypothetical protein
LWFDGVERQDLMGRTLETMRLSRGDSLVLKQMRQLAAEMRDRANADNFDRYWRPQGRIRIIFSVCVFFSGNFRCAD